MRKTKIDWCDYEHNIVIGCCRGCAYCYARKMNDRFHWVKDFAVPELRDGCLHRIMPKEPASIFADSISDPEYWTAVWLDIFKGRILDSSPNARFILLTKSPKTVNSVREIMAKGGADLTQPGAFSHDQRLFIGYSCGDHSLASKAIDECPLADRDADYDFVRPGVPLNADFLSIEPLMGDLGRDSLFQLMLSHMPKLRLVIVGAETGNRKGKVECKKEWVDGIVEICDRLSKSQKVAVFMKSSLKDVMGPDIRQDRLPWPCSKQKEAE